MTCVLRPRLRQQAQEGKNEYLFLQGFGQDMTGGQQFYTPNTQYDTAAQAWKVWKESEARLAALSGENYHARNERAWSALADDAPSREVYSGVLSAEAEAARVLAVLKTLSGSTARPCPMRSTPHGGGGGGPGPG